MSSHSQAKGILKSVEIGHANDNDESLASAIDDDSTLIKLVTERENQEEIEVDINDL